MIFRQFPFRKFETAGENCKQNPERQHDHNDLAHGCAVNLKRTKRAESGVVKSMAEQYGMTDAEVAEILEAERQKRAKQLSPEQQKLVDGQLARANELLIAADVRNTGAVMGLIDAETALLLLDRTNVKVDDKGAVTGVKEALEALKTAKPYLFGTPQAAPDGNAVVRVTSGGAHGGGVEPDYSKMSDEEYYKTIFNKNK